MITFESFLGFPENYFNKSKLTNWLISCAEQYGVTIDRLAYKFCDEETMLEFNQKFLQHDYYTDILTFPDKNRSGNISGDILINIDRLRENAKAYNQAIEQELLRLLAHGLLHLCGFRDETNEEKSKMRKAEQWCISVLSA